MLRNSPLSPSCNSPFFKLPPSLEWTIYFCFYLSFSVWDYYCIVCYFCCAYLLTLPYFLFHIVQYLSNVSLQQRVWFMLLQKKSLESFWRGNWRMLCHTFPSSPARLWHWPSTSKSSWTSRARRTCCRIWTTVSGSECMSVGLKEYFTNSCHSVDGRFQEGTTFTSLRWYSSLNQTCLLSACS